MQTKYLSLSSKYIQQWMLLSLLVLVACASNAYAACCTGHGGVASCNKATGIKMCKDGTASPTCTCPKEKVKKPKAVTPKKATPMPKATAPKTTAPKAVQPKSTGGSWWGGKTKSTPASEGSGRGCCSRHGGVSQCNTATGKQMCKDGTESPSCVCH